MKSYPKWNPQIIDIMGTLCLNEKIRAKICAPDGSGTQYTIKAKIVDYEKNKCLAWKGGVPLLLYGHHYWKLVSAGEETQFIHGEAFYGLYPLFMTRKSIDLLKPAYEAFNIELKKYICAL